MAGKTLLCCLAAALALAAADARAAAPPWYLALGDSLAAGIQPDAAGADVLTRRGYASDLYAILRRTRPGLHFENLACPGETTATMRAGGIAYCPYPLGSQLAQATAFLRSHRIALVTLDIGANDVDRCVGASRVDASCLSGGLAAVQDNLPRILAALRAAAGARVPIVAMDYYDPFLAVWLEGTAGHALARRSEQLLEAFDGLLRRLYGAAHVPVAAVAAAFRSTDFTPVPLVGTPANVALVCALTWMCAPPPVGPNVHANAAGYARIASAFAKTIGR